MLAHAGTLPCNEASRSRRRSGRILLPRHDLDYRFSDKAPHPDDQLDWLDRALAESRADWKIALGHHPVLSGGAHGSTLELVDTLNPIFERHGVAAYFNGHDHDLQHIVVGGIHYVTCGAGSQTRKTRKIEGTLFAASKLGFMAASPSSGALAFQFVGADAQTLYRAEIPARG